MNVPVYAIVSGREKTVRTFHPWVFSGALVSEKPVRHIDLDATLLPSIARVEDHKGAFLAWAQVNPESKIRLRLCTWLEKTVPDTAWLTAQIDASFTRRKDFESGDTNVMRLLFAESDGVPGVVIDRMGDWLLVQIETAGADSWRLVLQQILPAIAQKHFPQLRGILERSDGDGRSLEGLAPRRELWWGQEPPAIVPVSENRIVFDASPGGQKTGFYADQRENRAAVARYAIGKRVLDVCCYSGAFAAYAVKNGAVSAHLVDASQDALDLALKNVERAFAKRNAEVDSHCGDAFKILRELQGKKTFDLIILDPPKLAPKRADLTRALAAYKDLNLQAMRLLEPGGILASFSCSGLVGADDLKQAISYAAKDLGKRFQILHRLYQGPDHPVTLAFPEAEYLKGFLLRLL